MGIERVSEGSEGVDVRVRVVTWHRRLESVQACSLLVVSISLAKSPLHPEQAQQQYTEAVGGGRFYQLQVCSRVFFATTSGIIP